MLEDLPNYKSYDKVSIEGKVYAKPEIGNDSWAAILAGSPGRFVDIMTAKFEKFEQTKSVNITIN